MSKVFLSHTSSDKPFVRKVAADLRGNGHTVWIDEAEIKIGESLIEKIRDGLDTVDYVAVVLSKASLQSEWVKKELEIASNREIEEKRVIVLPLILENVALPGFLKGKLYADFSDPQNYDNVLKKLLESLGDSSKIIKSDNEIEKIKLELKEAKQIAESHLAKLNEFKRYNLASKSSKLITDIEKENKQNPEFEAINNVYAFSIGDVSITLGYLLFVLQKIKRNGAHQLEPLLTMENKWEEVTRMLSAYSDMIDAL